MDFTIETTIAEARAALEAEFADAPTEHRADVDQAIEEVMQSVYLGADVIYNDYLNLELIIMTDEE